MPEIRLQRATHAVARRIPEVPTHRPAAADVATIAGVAVCDIVTTVPIARAVTVAESRHEDELVAGVVRQFVQEWLAAGEGCRAGTEIPGDIVRFFLAECGVDLFASL